VEQVERIAHDVALCRQVGLHVLVVAGQGRVSFSRKSLTAAALLLRLGAVEAHRFHGCRQPTAGWLAPYFPMGWIFLRVIISRTLRVPISMESRAMRRQNRTRAHRVPRLVNHQTRCHRFLARNGSSARVD
jgi:hypothetical protein